jgi:hypothetical protein
VICETCHRKEAETGHPECFRCRVASVGFAFVGGGGYGRSTFAARTNNEFLNEFVGDVRNDPNIEQVHNGVWS